MKDKSDASALRRLMGIGLSSAIALTLTGCPYGADLEATGEGGCEEAPEIFAQTCSGVYCHTGPDPDGSVDLISPGFEAALLTSTATYEGVFPNTDACPMPPPLYVDPAAPEESWLLKKLKGTHGDCGGRMPNPQGLPQEAQDCIEAWVLNLAQQGAP